MIKGFCKMTIFFCVLAFVFPTVVQAAEIPQKRVFAGSECSFVIKDDGSLWGWGRNKSGRLGDGTDENRVNPVKIMDDVASYYANYDISFAIKTDGSLWGWGGTTRGLILSPELTPQKLMDDVKQASGDGGMAAMILKNDGSLWIAGVVSQAGGTVYESPTEVMDGVRWAQMDSGVFQAIKNDGTLWVWGDAAYERLGKSGDATVPIKLMDNVAGVTSDFDATYIVQNDGTLWGVGVNNGGKLRETNNIVEEGLITTPIKLDDGVSPGLAVFYGDSSLYYVKNNADLWKLMFYFTYSNRGEFTYGTRPVKVMDYASHLDSSGNHMFIVQENGNVWAVGKNEYGQLGDGTTDSKFDSTELARVTKASEAVAVLESAINSMDETAKSTPADVNNIVRYAEEAVAMAANKNVADSTIHIDKAFAEEMLKRAEEAQSQLEETLIGNGIELNRSLNKNISVTTAAQSGFTVTVERSVLDTDIDEIYVQNSEVGITINRENLEELAAGESYTVSTEALTAALPAPGTLIAAKTSTTYTIKMNTDKTPVKVKVPVKEGTVPSQMAATNGNGDDIVSQYNSANSKMEFKTSTSGSYILKENVKDFSDIQDLSRDVQNAIKYLANKNVLFDSGNNFMPNQNVSRAEIATLLVKAAGRYDANANANFDDVPKSKWYSGGVGSAHRMGIVDGVSSTQFDPEGLMLKDQIVAVSARLLKVQRKYNTPRNPDGYLNRFSDRADIRDWSKPDLALAVLLDIITYRADGRLNPQGTVSRADAAMIVYRTFQHIW